MCQPREIGCCKKYGRRDRMRLVQLLSTVWKTIARVTELSHLAFFLQQKIQEQSIGVYPKKTSQRNQNQ